MSIPDDDYGPTGGEGAPRSEAAPAYEPGGGSLIPEARSGPVRQRVSEVDAALARDRIEAEHAADEAREQAARTLEHIFWDALDGARIPIHWTAGRHAEMENLEEAAGLYSVPGAPLSDGTLSAYIFLYLGIHTPDTWEEPRLFIDEQTQRPLRLPAFAADRVTFLRKIREFADEEFPVFHPDTPARRNHARDLLRQVRILTGEFRPEEVPDENEPAGDAPKK